MTNHMTTDAISPRLKRDVSSLEVILVEVTTFIASIVILVYYPWLAVPTILLGFFAFFLIFRRSRKKRSEQVDQTQNHMRSRLSN